MTKQPPRFCHVDLDQFQATVVHANGTDEYWLTMRGPNGIDFVELPIEVARKIIEIGMHWDDLPGDGDELR